MTSGSSDRITHGSHAPLSRLSRATHAESHLEPILLWMAKLEGLPGVKLRQTKVMRGYKPLAESLHYLHKMARECFSMLTDQEKRYYNDPDRWFALVFEERLGAGEQPANVNLVDYADLVQEEVKQLACSTEPKNIYCSKTEPHSWRLMELAIYQEGISNRFRNQLFKPFVKALRQWKNVLQRDGVFVAVRADDCGFYYRKYSKSPRQSLDIKLKTPKVLRSKE